MALAFQARWNHPSYKGHPGHPACRGFLSSAAQRMKPLSMKNQGTQVYPHVSMYLRPWHWIHWTSASLLLHKPWRSPPSRNPQHSPKRECQIRIHAIWEWIWFIMIYHHGVTVVTGYIHSIRWDFQSINGAAQPHTVCQGASGIEMPQHHMQRCHVSRQAKGEALRRPWGRPWTPSRSWLHRQHHRLELMDLLARLRRRPRLLWCSWTCWCCW